MLFNVLERRFNIFGFPFWPQDFYIFVLVMITMVVFVILFTVVLGAFSADGFVRRRFSSRWFLGASNIG
jgi:polyferredoxin